MERDCLKETSSYRIVLRLIKMLDVVMMAVPVLLGWRICYADGVAFRDFPAATPLVAGAFVALYMTYGRIYESFLVSVSRISEMIYSQCLALLMSDALMYIILSLLARRIVEPVPMLGIFASQVLLSAVWCTAAHIWYFRTFSPKKTAIIFGRRQSVEELIHAYGLRKKFDVKKIVPVERCISDMACTLGGVETVFLCDIHSHERNAILKYCVGKNITAYILPRIGDIIMSGARRMHLFHLPFLRVGSYDPAPEYLLIKRLFDILASVFALVLLAPVMLITALAIKLTDGGPVFYRQKRLTRNGKEFYVLKFRSMRQDAELDGVARLSTGCCDDRITPVGRVIRKFRIDELPQFINILQGSMSIVGPRPERPEIAAEYENELPEFCLRLQAKAGLTGYAQIYGKYNTNPYDKLQMDLMYIAHPSFLEDLRIIFATIKIIFLPESTQGVAEGMKTALENQEKEKEVIEV